MLGIIWFSLNLKSYIVCSFTYHILYCTRVLYLARAGCHNVKIIIKKSSIRVLSISLLVSYLPSELVYESSFFIH